MLDGLFGRREDEQKLYDENRVPPGQSITRKFPVLHYGPVPGFNPQTWTFKIWGLVEEPLELSWEQFSQLPRRKIMMDLHCVTQWSKFDTVWEGVSVADLVNQGVLKLKPEARYVLQHAEFGFTANLPLDIVLQDNFLLATHFDGQPITPDHGYPLRGVIGAIPSRPDLVTPYLWKGAKWLRGLEFLSEDKLGFWEQAGYHNRADVWNEERYA